ncbi:MAG: carbon-nitrogen hydrolase [Thiohalobacterales bacterium]|nr:carbon-nitrogen hydrolase [Thiohalobacterales bacterium]
MDRYRITTAVVQHACSADPEANLQASIAGLEDAAARGAQLVLLQELHRSLYFCQQEDDRHFALAEPVPGETTALLGETAARLGIVIVASLFERRAAGLYHNTAVVLDRDGSLAGRYRKMHIPDDPGYYEKYYFTPGDLGFTPIETSLGTLGVLVCWDQWYPEAARLMALAGADILLYPTAIGWDEADPPDEQARQLEAWLTIQRAHAISNCLPVLTCNRVGYEAGPEDTSGIRFWGNSCIIGAQGELLARAGSEQPAVTLAEIDPRRTEQLRRTWPFLRDRRIDAYEDLLKRYRT